MAQDSNGPDRLDSWKAIAAYLRRDERTVRRWEREQGLPVRRVPGRRGTSVFAYPTEIDAWLDSQDQTARGQEVDSPRPPDRRPWLVPVVAALLVVTIGGLAVGLRPPPVVASAELTPQGIVARSAQGTELWRYAFPDAETFARPDLRPHGVDVSSARGVLAATSHWVRDPDDTVRGGQLLSLSMSGSLRRRFTLDDVVAFEEREFAGPWAVTDFRVEQTATPRIALAAHDFHWWPSLVTVIDHAWRRTGTFVNPGWMEGVHWLAPDRLLAAGYNEPLNGGAVTLLDPLNMNGHVPLPRHPSFTCTRCGDDRPLRYVVMPRSEVNVASASRFNRATLQVSGDRIVARTIEMPTESGDAADAIYEFDRALNLKHAAFSARYWEMHDRLERERVIDHPRASCPDRGGPAAIYVWEPSAGWRTIALR